MRPIEDARQAILDSSPTSAIYLGCDSKRYKRDGRWHAKYATVIIIHRDSCHGAQIFGKIDDMDDYGNIRMRMMNEVSFAIHYASQIIDIIGDRKFEIHIDVNPNPKHKSNAAVKEAIGYVIGTFGFEPQIKPNAPAASYAADWLVRRS